MTEQELPKQLGHWTEAAVSGAQKNFPVLHLYLQPSATGTNNTASVFLEVRKYDSS